jgi:hypothetical protein
MATKGQVLANPETGDLFEFLETSADSDGKRVVIRSTVNTKGELVPPVARLFGVKAFFEKYTGFDR